ncbi:MAG: AraC family transcriptional regulator [Vicingaceae bacterium]
MLNNIIQVKQGTTLPQAVFNSKNKLIHSSLNRFEKQSTHKGISIKYVVEGKESYCIDGEQFCLTAGDLILVNSGQELQCQIKSKATTKGLCIYLDEQMVSHRYAESFLTEEQKLSSGNLPSVTPEFRNIIYNKRSSSIGKTVEQLAQVMTSQKLELREEFYYKMIERLIHHHLTENQLLQKFSCQKKSTREERYKRIMKCVAYLHQHYDQKLKIEEIAKIACMSPFHFIRSFKECMTQSPNQYLEKLRLEKAAEMLLKSGLEVQEIAFRVGYLSASSFGKDFKSLFHLSPLQYRKANS